MKYALVTGSTKGIGREIGISLLKNDYYVIFNYFNDFKSAEVLDEFLSNQFKGKYSIIKEDFSDYLIIDVFVKKIEAITKSLNVIVFNVGITDRSNFEQITWEIWQKVFNTNLSIPFFLLKSLFNILIDESSIVFIGSLLGNITHSSSLSYGVSKSAVHSLVKNLVKYLAQKKIRVNGIAPGFVDTNWQNDKPDWLKEKIMNKIALERFCAPNEISSLVMLLIENNYINGEIIQIDGGYNYK